MMNPLIEPCPDDRLTYVRDLAASDSARAIPAITKLIEDYPGDARLPFLRGSLAAGLRDYASARDDLRQAVTLAPGYAIARFQFGLLLLTSGEAHEAQSVLQPLLDLGEEDALHHFAAGLLLLMQDRFEEAVIGLERGLECNRDNLPLNRDMTMLIGEIRTKMDGVADDGPLSAAHLLLQQSALKATKH
jgi:Flp pilus assembly protein TadD